MGGVTANDAKAKSHEGGGRQGPMRLISGRRSIS